MRNFFIVGVGKCGTTSLYEYLGQHPDIAMSDPKETRFFLHPDGRSYEDFFDASPGIKVRGEATPDYFPNSETARAIKRYDPDARIIILIRNPIDRAYSHYTFNVASFKERRGVIDAIREDHAKFMDGDMSNHNIITPGMYSRFVPVWRGMFENVLVLSYEDFFSDVNGNMGKVFDFLEVDRFPVEPAVHNKTVGLNAGALYKATAWIPTWFRRAVPYFVRRRIAGMMLSGTPPPLSCEAGKVLLDIYRDEVGTMDSHLGDGR